MRDTRWLAGAAAVIMAVSSQHSRLQAQSTPQHQIAMISVALVDHLPPGYRQYQAVILRRPHSPHDVILLPRATATPALLDAATRTLLRVRAAQGNEPTKYKGRTFKTVTIGVRTPGAAPAAWTSKYASRLQALIKTLGRAPRSNIPGVGLAQSVNFYPPKV